ncbi:MAG: hypothetical protein HY834_09770 [Devosia nanyangense]|uniref:Uncharacterized protein n=1 Tax=Devosia nanyangense TaxID=1228055 RepID=A0A933NY92_9HYPH|nr:hypothetical protein [Devosia nanyangense]
MVVWAALHLLPLREQEAISALEEVSKGGIRLIAFEADVTLREWRAGRLKIE